MSGLLTQRAVDLVLADVVRATSEQPRVIVSVWMDDAVCIEINGGCTAPSIRAKEEQAATVEVADYIQEQLDEELGRWPVAASPTCQGRTLRARAEGTVRSVGLCTDGG